MRLIGHLPDEDSAQRFSNFLLIKNIESQMETESDGQWAVWIHDEETLEQAIEELKTYQNDPKAEKYVSAGKLAEGKKAQQKADQAADSKRQFDRKNVWPQTLMSRAGVCTFSLLAISIVVFVFMLIDEGFVRQWLSIVELKPKGDMVEYSTKFLFDVRHGQVWRLFTPMFIHFDILHIFMNMWLLVDLGGAIERRYGTKWTLALILIIAAFSNILEYAFNSPNFGGMSGVVFGLFGFVLVQSKYNPFSNFFVSPMMTAILLFWFVYCIVVPGNIANFVHWGGLASGAVIGYFCSLFSIHRPVN